VIPGANHFFNDQLEAVISNMERYLDARLAQAAE